METVKFTEKDFSQFRKFQNKMNVVFGESAYVDTAHAMVLLEYSPTLNAMIRPYPKTVAYEFEVKFLYCEDCKKSALFLAIPDENTYVCPDCVVKRIKRQKKQLEQQLKQSS